MADRFTDNGNGTVTDTKMGLMWQKDTAPERITWPEAQSYIQQLNETGFADHSDWRLPDNEELRSLMTPVENSRRLYLDPIFGYQRCFWSSTTRDHHTACYLDFYYGEIYRIPEIYVNHSVRAVRGEMKVSLADEQSAA
jgi:serine/threonine-protein kinase